LSIGGKVAAASSFTGGMWMVRLAIIFEIIFWPKLQLVE